MISRQLPSVYGFAFNISFYFYLTCLLFLGAYYPKYGAYATYDWLGLFAVLFCYGAYIVKGFFPLMGRVFLLFFSLLFVGSALTALRNSDLSGSVFSFLLMVYTLMIWLQLPSILFQSWAHIRLGLVMLVLSVMITVTYAFGIKYLGFTTFSAENFWGREIGLTRHPNELGALCGMIISYPLALWGVANRTVEKVVWGSGILLCALGVLISGSMSGALTLLIVAGSYAFFAAREARIHTLLFALLGLGVILIANAEYINENTQSLVQRIELLFLSSDEGSRTLQSRVEGDIVAFNYILSNPFQGNGFDSTVMTFDEDIFVHNTFLKSWYDGGIFTFLSVLTLFWAGLIAARDAMKSTATAIGGESRMYVSAIVSSYMGFLLMIQVSPVLYQRSSVFPLALVLSLPYVVRRTCTN